MLDKTEARNFIEELQKIVNSEMSGNYKPENFDKLFTQYDDDKNGYLEKKEMCVFIKKNFRKPETVKAA